MYNVEKVQLFPQANNFELPETFGMYRDNGTWLGSVGKGYHYTQPSEILQMFEQACEQINVDCGNIEVREFLGGRKLSFRIPLENFDVIIPKGNRKIGDEVRKSISFTTSYDGSTSNYFEYFVERLACLNGMTRKDHLLKAKFRHTVSQTQKIKLLADAIVTAHNHQKAIEQSFQRLANAPFEPKFENVQSFIKKLVGYDLADANKEEGKTQVTRVNKVNSLSDSIYKEINEIGDNLWGLFNGVTWYTNHEVQRDDQLHYIQFAQGKTINDKALQLVEAMV